jgi:hypothetical protein
MSSFGELLMNIDLNRILRKLRDMGVLPKPLGYKFLDRIPTVPLSEIVSKPTIRVVGTYSYVDGYLPWCDILALMSVLVDRSPHTILEVGTFNGYTTRLMALNLPDAEIHTLDLPEDFTDTGTGSGLPKDDFHLIGARRVGSEYRSDPSIKSIQQHFGDSAEIVFPIAEFCFIDGSHTYAYARNDTEKALASGAAKTLVWHDCNHLHPGVTSWLIEMIQAGHPVRRIEGTNLAILDVLTQPSRN